MLIECEVHYDAEQDRLVGGDFDREVNGHWARSTLLPRSRLDRLWTRLGWLDRIFQEDNPLGPDDPVPYPRPLTAIAPNGLPGAIDGHPQLVLLDLAFAGTALRSAPPEFRDVIQLVCLIDDPTTLANRRPTTRDAWTGFATNLFGVLGCIHRQLHMALTRGAGSSVEPAAISASGHLLDLYHLVGPGDLPGPQVHRGQREDLARALGLLAIPDSGALRDLITTALGCYWGTADRDARSLPAAASGLADRLVPGWPAAHAVTELAASALSMGW